MPALQRLASLTGVALLLLALVTARELQPVEAPRTSQALATAHDSTPEMVERGRYLVAVTGCGDCHSPHDEQGRPVPGRELSGHPEGAPLPEWDPTLLDRNILVTFGSTFTAAAGPFGLSVAGNLTPHPETGTGKLTADALVESWRTGKHWKFDKRPVLPPMPMEAYKLLTEEDVRAIHAYLMSLPPIDNRVPLSVPATAAHG